MCDLVYNWTLSLDQTAAGDSDSDPYSRLIPRERVHVGSAESEGEEECDGEETPRTLTGSIGGVCVCVCVCVCLLYLHAVSVHVRVLAHVYICA